jgi:hypothetical protein
MDGQAEDGLAGFGSGGQRRGFMPPADDMAEGLLGASERGFGDMDFAAPEESLELAPGNPVMNRKYAKYQGDLGIGGNSRRISCVPCSSSPQPWGTTVLQLHLSHWI